MKKFYLQLFVSLLVSFGMFAQEKRVDWTRMSNNPNATFYEVVADFNNFWKDKTPEKGKGYKVFKRWEANMAPKVFPTGNMALTQTAYQNFLSWQKTQTTGRGVLHRAAAPTSTGNWSELGPTGSPSGPSPYSRTGAGRVNFLRFDPTNAATMYVGAADGGLWKSTNSGTSWTTNTDFLTVIGCSDLCINPTNTQIMYLATGDLEGAKSSNGILKSTDGGTTWTTTSLVLAPSNYYRITKLLMDPTDPLTMLAATNGGIFKTTNGWATYSQPQTTGIFMDMEFKPGDPNTVYASGSTVFKSTNKGGSWAQITSGLPASTGVQRIALGVTAGNAAYVYALVANNTNYGFLGLYRSTDSGTTFASRSTAPNILGYQADGLDSGGQGFYDLAISVSATDPENVITGGVNHWKSLNGGTTWTNLSFWAAGQVHADIHEIVYSPDNTTIYSCNDGGIFKTTNGTAWTDISNNLAISQEVGLGLSSNDSNKIVIGTQDNGTSLKTGAAWANIRGGDGGDCFIDPTDNNTVYSQYVYGDFARQTISPATSTTITTGLPTPLNTNFDFYSPWKMDPVNSSRLYTGGANALYTSANKGTNWTALGTPSGTGRIKGLAIAPSNTATIYCIKNDAISISTDSGVTFTNKTGALPVGLASLSNICISNTDANKVWVTFSGYSAGNKVFKSTNGGTTWTNVSTGLPNLSMNTIVYTNNTTNDAIYVGGEIGVYYMDNTTGSFANYMTNLPNTSVNDLEIYYPNLKLRAATYGRGTWESPLNNLTTVDITASAGVNGTISPTGVVNVISGTNQTFTITPASCYSTATVLVDGVNNPAAVTSGTYTFTNVTTTHTISVTFTPTMPFVIATTCIPPAAPTNLGSFEVGPTKVVLGTINNTSSGSNASNNNRVLYDYTKVYCLTGYSTSLTVSSNPQSITLRCTGNSQKFSAWIDYNNDGTFTSGELIVTDQAVTLNTDTAFAFSIPNTGVVLNTPLRMRVIGDFGVNSSTAPCAIRNYGEVEDYQVTVIGTSTFAITASTGTGGTVTPAGVTNVASGGNQTYTITPAACYSIATVLIDGVNNTTAVSSGTYTFSNVTAVHTISATFTAVTITSSVTSQTNVSCNGGSNGSASVSPSGGATPYTYSWSPSGGTAATATGLAAGTYTVTVTDANACTATRNFTITQPTVISTATAAQTNVSCNGGSNGSASVTPSGGAGGYTYSWSPSGGTAATATGLAAGTYTVTVTDANGCQATRNFTITQPAATLAPTGTAAQSFCNNETVNLIAVTGTGIVWYTTPTGGSVVSGSTLLVSGTTYYASQTVTGCESIARLAVTMTTGSCLATDVFDLNGFTYYPNPVSSILTLNYSEELTNIKISNLLGQHILSKTIHATSADIDMSNLPSGTYFVEVYAGDVSKIIKLLKK